MVLLDQGPLAWAIGACPLTFKISTVANSIM
jgi:hypothetical protein